MYREISRACLHEHAYVVSAEGYNNIQDGCGTERSKLACLKKPEGIYMSAGSRRTSTWQKPRVRKKRWLWALPDTISSHHCIDTGLRVAVKTGCLFGPQGVQIQNSIRDFTGIFSSFSFLGLQRLREKREKGRGI